MSHQQRIVVQGEGLCRIYAQGSIQVHALRDVDLQIRAGEFTALAGPSGSGKSTLLNIIGCLDSPTSGTLRLDGKTIKEMSRGSSADFRLKHIGFVFQAYNLVPVLTAYENASFTLYLQGVSERKRKKIVVPLMERMGLADLMNRKPHEMSGGQQQRVAVVRAIASSPRFILADEPTANLDSKSANDLLDLMEELNRDREITFLFATHDPKVLERVSRVISLSDGEIISDERKE